MKLIFIFKGSLAHNLVFWIVHVRKGNLSYVDERTLKQSGSTHWYETRVGRITASTAHCVLHTGMNNPSKSLIKKICGPAIYGKAIQAASISWGKANEKVALNELKDTMSLIHTDFEITECA